MLDAGCGAGVLGICAAGALSDIAPPGNPPAGRAIRVRAQDRDVLARVFTEYNARKNGLSQECFEAHTEPLLAAPDGAGWDLILTNIPAKAGRPVLEDFIRRSAGLLKKDGMVFLVAVHTLADFFRSGITASASLIKEETGKEHSVFVYTKQTDHQAEKQLIFDENFPKSYPFYIRCQNEYEIEKISYKLDTVHGAPDFDSPGGAIQAAAKLALKIDLVSKLSGGPSLIHDTGQGHFALWLLHYLAKAEYAIQFVLSGRNVLALAAARAALASAGIVPAIIPIADIFLDRERLTLAAEDQSSFALIALFPEMVTDTIWEGLASLAATGGIVIAGMTSTEAERFDRKKPPSFSRMGDIRRKGFRALAYRKT